MQYNTPMKNNYEFLSTHASESLRSVLLYANFKIRHAISEIDFDEILDLYRNKEYMNIKHIYCKYDAGNEEKQEKMGESMHFGAI